MFRFLDKVSAAQRISDPVCIADVSGNGQGNRKSLNGVREHPASAFQCCTRCFCMSHDGVAVPFAKVGHFQYIQPLLVYVHCGGDDQPMLYFTIRGAVNCIGSLTKRLGADGSGDALYMGTGFGLRLGQSRGMPRDLAPDGFTDPSRGCCLCGPCRREEPLR